MKPFVSVILPCRDEVRFLGPCLDSVLASDYPEDRVEILVADGMSTDGSRELIASYSRKYARVRMLDNPQRITPTALNRAIEAARGDIVLRMDAHSTIACDYLIRAVDHLERDGADNVGGVMRTVARDHGPFSKAIRLVLSHPFGVGDSHFRTGGRGPFWVDTVFGGCWRRELFARVGMFNEKLARGQDMEFNQRLTRAGGRILLAPDLHSYYFARTALIEFLKHNWTNGVWAVLPFAYSDAIPVRWRHLMPMAFVAAVLVSLFGFLQGMPWLPLAVACPYASGVAVASLSIARKAREPQLLATLPVTFLALHLPYGLGSLWGALRLCGIGVARMAAGIAGRREETTAA